MNVIEKKVAKFIAKHNIMLTDAHALVALSGGADSVALLRILLAVGVRCRAVHCNFGLRGAESDRDESFVRTLCQIHKVPLTVKQFDVARYEREHRVSTEMACRELRYEWFEEERKRACANVIAVAHHHDDNVETMFLNILRGSGIQGLSGIKPRNGMIVRPLLCLTRVEIEDYLKCIGQEFVVDSTNLENDFKRNKIRNVLLPCVRSLFPNADVGIARTLQNLQGCNDLYQISVARIKQDLMKKKGALTCIDKGALCVMEEARSTILFELLKDFGFNSVDAANICDSISEPDSVGNIYLSMTHEAVIERETIDIFPRKNNEESSVQINLPKLLTGEINDDIFVGQLVEPSLMSEVNGRECIALDVSILQNSPILTLRKWCIGDRIRPYGMRGSKLVSAILHDAKFSEYAKRRTQVLVDEDGEVIWILGVRASRKYSVKTDDTEFIRLSVK